MAAGTTNRLESIVAELRRCNELLRVLSNSLVEQLQEPDDAATRGCVLDILDEMLKNLLQQFQLEEKNGYMAEVLEQFPNWHPQVEHLRQQHGLLHQQLVEIRDRIAAQPADSRLIAEMRRQLVDWTNTYNEHQEREAVLIQDAFTLETGVGE